MFNKINKVIEDIHAIRALMECFIKAMATDGAAFPVILVKDETKEPASPSTAYRRAFDGMRPADGISEDATSVTRRRGKDIIPQHFIKADTKEGLKVYGVFALAEKIGKTSGEIVVACNICDIPVYEINKRRYIPRNSFYELASAPAAFWDKVREAYDNAESRKMKEGKR